MRSVPAVGSVISTYLCLPKDDSLVPRLYSHVKGLPNIEISSFRSGESRRICLSRASTGVRKR